MMTGAQVRDWLPRASVEGVCPLCHDRIALGQPIFALMVDRRSFDRDRCFLICVTCVRSGWLDPAYYRVNFWYRYELFHYPDGISTYLDDQEYGVPPDEVGFPSKIPVFSRSQSLEPVRYRVLSPLTARPLDR